MLNIIRGEFFRMMKSKSTWVILIIAILISFMTLSFIGYVPLRTSQSPTEQPDSGISISVNEDADLNITTMEGLLGGLFSGTTYSIFIIVFAVLFSGGHNKTGYIKNIQGIVGKKYKFLLLKGLMVCIFTAVFIILITVAASISGVLFFDNISFDFSSAWSYLGIQFVLLSGLGIIVSFFTEVVRSNLAALLVWIIYSTGFGVTFVNLVDGVLYRLEIVSETFSIHKYLILGNLWRLAPTDIPDYWLRLILVPLIICGIGFVLSAIIIEKQDVK